MRYVSQMRLIMGYSLKTFIEVVLTSIGLALAFAFAFSSSAQAGDVPQSFTLDGKLYSNAASTAALVDSNVLMKVQILDEDRTCVLYEEQQSLSTLASAGYFSVQVGSNTGDAKRTAGDSGNTMSSVFQNLNNVSGKKPSDGTPCTVTATGAKRRYVRISITPSTMGSTTRVLSPDLTIDSVPNAVVAERAESLQGYRSADMLKVNILSGNVLSQSNLESLFSSTARFNALTALVDGTSSNYMRSNSAGGAQLPVITGAPTAPVQGAIWYDTSDNMVKYRTGLGTTQTLSTGGGGGVSSVDVAAPTNEFTVSGGPVTASGTITLSWKNQNANVVFAGPSSGGAAAPAFRTLVAADIPSLDWSKIGSGTPTTLAGYGVTDAVRNVTGTPSITTGLDAAKGAGGTVGRLYIASDTKLIYRDNGATWDQIGGSSSPTGSASGDLSGTYPNPGVAKIQGVSVSATTPTAGQVLKNVASVWTPVNFGVGDLLTAAGAAQFGSASCTTSQTLTWSALTGAFTCSNIGSLDAAAITTGTVATARLGSGTADGTTFLRGDGTWAATLTSSTAFVQNGNSFSGTATLGTNDAYDLYFETAGVPRAIISATNGTTSFASPNLALGSGASNLAIFSTDTQAADVGGALGFGGQDGGTTDRTFARISGRKSNSTSGNYDGYLAFETRANGSLPQERMRILSDGSVGIGSTSPGALLQLGTAGTSLGTMRMTGSTSGYVQVQPAAAAGSWTMTLPPSAGSSGQVLSTNGAGVTSWTTALTSSTGFIQDGNSFSATARLGTNDTNNLQLETNNVVRMVFDTSGHFAIGQSTVDGDVIGTIQAPAATSSYLRMRTPSAGAASGVVMATPTGDWHGGLYTFGSTSTSPNLMFLSNTQEGIVFETGTAGTATEKMRILSGGNVGIGATSPGAKLDVTGAANAIAIQSTGYSLTGANAQSLMNFTGTWNTTGTPTLLKANVTDTASNAASLLLDLQVGGVSKFKVDKTGKVTGDGSGLSGVIATASSDASNNTKAGTSALAALAAGGVDNTAFGKSALAGVTTGDKNTAIGNGAGAAISTAVYNTAIGDGALAANNSNQNVAVGKDALLASTGGSQNVALGSAAMESSQGNANVAAGYGSLSTGGDYNVALGYQAGANAGSSSSSNVFLGMNAGPASGNVSNTLYIHNAVGTPTIYADFSTGAVGLSTVSPAAKLDVTDTSTTTSAVIVPRAGNFTGTTVNGMIRYNTASTLFEFRQNGAWVNYTTVSDGRLKTNVEPVVNGLDIVNQLNPVFYDWDRSNPKASGFEDKHQVGFIAQEVEKVLPEVVNKGEDSYRSLEYGKIVSVVVAAVKELAAKVLDLESRLDAQADEQKRELASVNEKLEADNRAKELKIKELEARLEKIEKALESR